MKTIRLNCQKRLEKHFIDSNRVQILKVQRGSLTNLNSFKTLTQPQICYINNFHKDYKKL